MSLSHSETCCICYDNLNDINMQNAKKKEQAKEDQLEIVKNPIFCNHCIEGAVCYECYDNLIENDLDEKCPICKRTDWNPVIIEMNIIEQSLFENEKEEIELKCDCTCNNIFECIYFSILNFLKVSAIVAIYALIFFMIGFILSLFITFNNSPTSSLIGYIGIMILRGLIIVAVLIIFGLCCCCCSYNGNDQNPDDFLYDNLAGLVLYWFIKVIQFFYS